MMSEFGEKIKILREERGLTVKDACQRVGIPQSRLSELERGVRLPTEGQISVLEQFYEVDPGVLEKIAASDS
jgi:transcriptional regulator with XRE-family HTH domain